VSANAKSALLLALLVLQSIYLGLGLKPMDKTQEVRVAETAREMVESGNWLVPHLNGELRLRKPPLAYWLTAMSYRAFGEVNEFTARFASATFAMLTTLVVFFWSRAALGLATALTISTCFVSSYLALRYFHSAETDAILLFFVTSGCALAYGLTYGNASPGRIVLLYLVMGLGFLTKGPAAIALPLTTMLALAVWKRNFAPLRRLINPLGIVVFAAIAFGWYAIIFRELPDAASYWVSEEIDRSFINGKYQAPFYWYWYQVFPFFLPWSLFIIPGAVWLYKTRPYGAMPNFALVWFLSALAILSLNANKQMHYALMLMPPLMILIGYYLARSEGSFAKLNGILFAILTVCGVAALGYYALQWERFGSFDVAPLALLLVCILLPVLSAKILRLPLRLGVLIVAGCSVGGFVYAQRYVYVAERERVEVRDFVARTQGYSPLFVYARGDSKVSFYKKRIIPSVKDERELASLPHETAYVIVDGKAPKWQLPVELVLEHGSLQLWRFHRQSE
jgi:4-amino-4-deoxy-L-arabinose transferase-like glycosyltransferase